MNEYYGNDTHTVTQMNAEDVDGISNHPIRTFDLI